MPATNNTTMHSLLTQIRRQLQTFYPQSDDVFSSKFNILNPFISTLLTELNHQDHAIISQLEIDFAEKIRTAIHFGIIRDTHHLLKAVDQLTNYIWEKNALLELDRRNANPDTTQPPISG